MLEAPKRAVKFAANDFWGKTCASSRSNALIVQLPRVVRREQDDAGPVGADGLHGRCDRGRRRRALRVRRQRRESSSPRRLVKIRLQDRASTYTGPIDVIRKTVASDGIMGMYKGLESTVWRHVMWSASAL